MDNTHNYLDFSNLESAARMWRISTNQKHLAGKYRCAIYATVEYRKRNVGPANVDPAWPLNDDIADSRVMTFRPSVIAHVYNDINIRQENATIFWEDEGRVQPRIIVKVTKNKVASKKSPEHVLVFDLYGNSTTLEPRDQKFAAIEAKTVQNDRESGRMTLKNNKVVYLDTEYSEE